MSFRELRDWLRFEAMQPLPDKLADLHAAILCSIAVNLMRAPESTPARPEDFLVIRPLVERVASDDGRSEAERARAQFYGGG